MSLLHVLSSPGRGTLVIVSRGRVEKREKQIHARDDCFGRLLNVTLVLYVFSRCQASCCKNAAIAEKSKNDTRSCGKGHAQATKTHYGAPRKATHKNCPLLSSHTTRNTVQAHTCQVVAAVVVKFQRG